MNRRAICRSVKSGGTGAGSTSILFREVVSACSAAPRGTYQQLVALFGDWRAFEDPPKLQGAPDYTAATSARRLAELATWQEQLRQIDTTGWNVSEQIDWHLVRAEMNGLDFDHRIRRP